ncbi:hypothetical protein SAMN04489727_1688 [Amycolatopsis tolypomycina]|uniref:Uncharacterized protein n=1 Tax=Amycolatopsis tolypomycina TaxID=208445 RepID=A0A1H4JAH3_9PSEU|nr:hypothetical protein [Amycolatopsis tolypomycina]SEB43157.1 hypothetical protein SAMN04489727_1688 [Amycolatopsis tolypomycina]
MQHQTTSSPSARLASVLLEQDLGDWVRAHRADDRSWAYIARLLHEKTDQQVSLSGEHLRRLYGPTPGDAAAKLPVAG